jgi:hypothetical protein
METAKIPHNWWMGQENVVFIHNGILLSQKEEWNFVIHKKMDGTGEHHLVMCWCQSVVGRGGGPFLHKPGNWLLRQLNDEPKLVCIKWDLLERKERL